MIITWRTLIIYFEFGILFIWVGSGFLSLSSTLKMSYPDSGKYLGSKAAVFLSSSIPKGKVCQKLLEL